MRRSNAPQTTRRPTPHLMGRRTADPASQPDCGAQNRDSAWAQNQPRTPLESVATRLLRAGGRHADEELPVVGILNGDRHTLLRFIGDNPRYVLYSITRRHRTLPSIVAHGYVATSRAAVHDIEAPAANDELAQLTTAHAYGSRQKHPNRIGVRKEALASR